MARPVSLYAAVCAATQVRFISSKGLISLISLNYSYGGAGSHFLTGLPELWHLGLQSLGSACPRSLDSVVDQTRRLNINGSLRTVHVLLGTLQGTIALMKQENH